MKNHFLVLITICFYTFSVYAQNAASANWPLSDPNNDGTGYTVITTGNIIAADELFKGTEVNGYTGANGSQRVRMAGTSNSWAANLTNQIDTVYVQFSVSPKSGFSFTITSLKLGITSASTATMKANIYYSTDAAFTNPIKVSYSTGNASNYLIRDQIINVQGTPNIIVKDGETFYVRLYPWHEAASVATGKYMCIQNVEILGVTSIGSTNQLALTTSAISELTSNSIKSGGNIISDGGDVVSVRGVCWNTNGNPTINDSKTVDGSGTGTFTSSITGLNPSTKYYLRAYATNAKGTSYGNEVLFTTLALQKLAFPTAEGYGRFTIGGRGGKVYEVTNLNDDNNPGSLRYAVNQSGPRTIVFRISGTIFLKSNLSIKNGYLTIAGQTAPGDGICIAGYTPSIDTDNVIVRYVRFRLGDINVVENDAFNGRNHKDIIIDHCSMSWSVDEVASFYDNQNFTMQWCIIGESLYNSAHDKGAHGYGGIQGGMGATFHHNLYIHNTSRNPRFCGARYHTSTYQTEIVDFVNNVIYNWGFNSIYGGELGQQNVRVNYFKAGPATRSSVTNRILNPSISTSPVAGYGKFYVADNYVHGFPVTTADNWGTGVQGVNDQIKAQVKVVAPFPIAEVKTHSAEMAYQAVLNIVGANFPIRDAIDTRLIEETKNGSATFEGTTYKLSQGIPSTAPKTGIIDSQKDVGGWPELKSLTAPVDTDHDGMPDSWETAHQLNINDATDGNKISSSGYTNLEDYLNELIASTVTEVKGSKKEMPASFTLYQNYPNPFNPSTTIRYQIPVVDALSGAEVHVTLKVYDILGKEVATLVNEYQEAGGYNYQFSIRDLPAGRQGYQLTSGVYFYRLQVGDPSAGSGQGFIQTKKMLLVK